MGVITVNTLRQMKSAGEKFSCVAAYDASFAQRIAEAGVETLLVGDSLGMVVQGHDSTLPVDVADICYHVAAVRRGANGPLIIADMPFMSYSSADVALESAGQLMKAGAHMVKLEGGAWLAETFSRLSSLGVPTCAHLGLTPQSVNKFGGYKVQGRDPDAASSIIDDALALQEAGADLLVLECVPTSLGCEVSKRVDMPVIGIGAGDGTDGQVLVIYDMLGVTPRAPKFAKDFLQQYGSIPAALAGFSAEVKTGEFPAEEHSFR